MFPGCKGKMEPVFTSILRLFIGELMLRLSENSLVNCCGWGFPATLLNCWSEIIYSLCFVEGGQHFQVEVFLLGPSVDYILLKFGFIVQCLSLSIYYDEKSLKQLNPVAGPCTLSDLLTFAIRRQE